MKTTLHSLQHLLLAVGLCAITTNLAAQTTAFTYQGRLDDGGHPASGIYDLRFTIYDAASGGVAVAGTLTNAATAVSNGLFTTQLDFGASAFTGTARWLEIGVRTNGGSGFTALTPRQPFASSPYAIRAANAATASTAGAVGVNAVATTGLQDGSVTSDKIANGTIAAADVNVATFGTTFWQAEGNAGTTPGTHFLGTTDNQPIEVRVNNQRALRLQPGPQAPNVIGGAASNSVITGLEGATIAGGGAPMFPNRITSSYAAIGGGNNNIASGIYATVSGGQTNTASDGYATVGGGRGNTASLGYATVGGGRDSIANGLQSTVGGGLLNTASGHESTVGGGGQNYIRPGATAATIGGGTGNGILTNSTAATIAGGWGNMIHRESFAATIPGGQHNTATNYAFAAGRRAKANHTGAFVWADSTDADFASSSNNQFLIRASGGVGINTTTPQAPLHVVGRAIVNGADQWDVNNTEGDFRVGSTTHRFKIGVAQGGGGAGDVWMRAHGGTARLFLKTPGGTTIFSNEGQSTGVTLSSGNGAWTTVSDRNAKENFAPVDPQEVLEKVAALPLSSWNYKSQDAAIRHLGPMAQDFKAAFGLGESDTGITTVDADGVALAAIKGLNQKLQQRESEIAELKQELAEIKRMLSGLVRNEN